MLNRRNIISGLLAATTSLGSQAVTIHEWGTFTSVVGSDGKRLQGLHHEEEPLPGFVYDLSILLDPQEASVPGNSLRRGMPMPSPSDERMPVPTFTTKVTQKMETPVVYFYSDKEEDVQVKVDFPKGTISQWYPKASSYNKARTLGNGTATWDVHVTLDKTGDLPTTHPDSIWNPSRETDANVILVEDEREKFIFYRGLADFENKLKVEANWLNLRIHNPSSETVPDVLVFNNKGDSRGIVSLGALGAGETRNIRLSTLENMKWTQVDYESGTFKMLMPALTSTGLFAKEAKAMINTWKKSYFETQGLRVLYILPSAWTEELLPMTVTPKPESLVRTLVGRIEVLTENEEKAAILFAKEELPNLGRFELTGRFLAGLGHFPEPKLRRASKLISSKITRAINNMNR